MGDKVIPKTELTEMLNLFFTGIVKHRNIPVLCTALNFLKETKMNLITAILLWLGLITSPRQATDEVVLKYDAEINKVMQDTKGDGTDCPDLVGLLVVLEEPTQ